jgi:catechol 2,3-dioxygenase-like lactoylglutathione lyase family enzyme
MFSHVTVGCTDLEKSANFYDAILLPLGLHRRAVTPDGGPESACWCRAEHNLPRFYVYMPFNGKAATAGNGSMVAFCAPSAAAVDDAFKAGLANGGISDGEPNLRPHYGDGYYGGYIRDPDGNKIHIVYRGDMVPLR